MIIEVVETKLPAHFQQHRDLCRNNDLLCRLY